ncbi:MAG: hypothetical protein KAS32_01785 [Candidatus Peribacteraceae bacterium]|nr:hypothetical protein [Candidatus Peribacteraceae bacterium]
MIYVICLTSIDGDIGIHALGNKSLREYLDKNHIGPDDYALIDGSVIKSFENTSFDINRVDKKK